MKKESAIISFVPVVHRGYIDFIKETDAKIIYLLDASDAPELEYLTREIRALELNETIKLLSSFGLEAYKFSEYIEKIIDSDLDIYMPNEDISHSVYKKYFNGRDVTFIDTFLRWDWKKSTKFKPVIPDADRIIKKGEPESK